MRERKAALILCFTFIILFSVSTLTTTTYSSSARSDIRRTDSYTQGAEHRRLGDDGGTGSYPPRCTDKCGGCTPCIPVLAQVPPVHTTQYYPQAWRCKCGGKLYIP